MRITDDSPSKSYLLILKEVILKIKAAKNIFSCGFYVETVFYLTIIVCFSFIVPKVQTI